MKSTWGLSMPSRLVILFLAALNALVVSRGAPPSSSASFAFHSTLSTSSHHFFFLTSSAWPLARETTSSGCAMSNNCPPLDRNWGRHDVATPVVGGAPR